MLSLWEEGTSSARLLALQKEAEQSPTEESGQRQEIKKGQEKEEQDILQGPEHNESDPWQL